MIRKIAGTALSRVLTGFILLGVLSLQTTHLGMESMADITLFKIALTFNNLVAAVFCGPALVYLGNRYPLHSLFLPAIIWILSTVMVVTGIQYFLDTYPPEYTLMLIFASLLFALQVFYENILLAREKILLYNASAVLHHVVLMLSTIFFLYIVPEISAKNYIFSLLTALGLNVVFMIISTSSLIEYSKAKLKKEVFVEIFKLGIMAQLTNFIQTLNYRISVLVLAKYWSKKQVGYFGAVLQLAEAIWIIGKSLAVVQYSRLSASTEKNYQINFTLAFAKTSIVLTLLAGATMLILPAEFYVAVFGVSFHDIRNTLLLLLPGIVGFSLVLSLSHYFSARGNFMINLIASAISLGLIVTGGYIFIPTGGIESAALVYSGGLLFLFFFYLVGFQIDSRVNLLRLLPQKSDIQLIKSTFINSKNSKS